MRLTDQQKEVIAAPRGNLLVSAAAGAGKTHVLAQRLVTRLVSGALDVRQMLVVTFTEAAARNMRDRIDRHLRQAFQTAADPQARQRIGQQLTLLPGASISTIHAFCLQVIKNFHHLTPDATGKAGLEPGFSVLGQEEADALLAQSLSDWMDSLYRAIDSDQLSHVLGETASPDVFYHLVDGFGNSRGDEPVRSLLDSTYRYLRSLPDYRQLIDRYLARLQETAEDFSSSPACQVLLGQLKLRLDRAMTVVPDLLDQLSESVPFLKNKQRNQETNQQFLQCLKTLCRLDEMLRAETADWDAVYKLGLGLEGLSVPASRKTDPSEKTAFLEPFITSVSEVLCFLTGQCCTEKYRVHFLFDTQQVWNQPASRIQEDIQAMLPAVRLFYDLVLGLDRRYSAKKQALGVIDFSDFEHLALALLRQDEAGGYYRDRFTEVYVDEYQDTSSIQETILQAVSQSNRFMVGDIKQSIYRFRHARPDLFRDRARAYAGGASGRLLELNQNFRSVSGILGAVNDVFSQLMSPGAGELTYNHQQALLPFRPDPADQPQPVRLMLIDRAEQAGPEDGPTEDLSRDEREVRAVLRELDRLHRAGRPWSDMAVLGRTRALVQTCQEMAQASGIPVVAQTGASPLDQPVLLQLQALLHLLDNSRQDIPLAAVLRSQITGRSCSLDDLAAIRLHGRKEKLSFFHEAVHAYVQTGSDPDLSQKLSDSLSWLATLRKREQVLPLGDLLELIYMDRGWLDALAAGPDAERQIRLLRRFQSWSEGYERSRRKGLYQLARFLEDVEKLALDPDLEEPAEAGGEAVRLMTIHASKGLEFPLVFVLGLSRRLLGQDQEASLVISEKLGIGFDVAGQDRTFRYPSKLKLAMREDGRAAELAEELRLLYVAMTRAEDRLYLVGSVDFEAPGKHRLNLIASARQTTSRCLPDHLVRSARTALDWLLLALARNPAVALSFLDEPAQGATGPLAEDPDHHLNQPYPGWLILDSRSVPALTQPLAAQASELNQPEHEQVSQRETIDQADQERLKASVLDPYRFEDAARLPLKVTVSELKDRPIDRLAADEDQAGWSEATRPLRGIGQILVHREQQRFETVGLEKAALGTALHQVLRYLDFALAHQAPTEAALARQLDRMETAGMISSEQRAGVAPFTGALARLASSQLVEQLVAAQAADPDAVHQETPFTLQVPASQVYGQLDGLAETDTVLIQGMIDLWFEEGSGLTLVDFKSDHLQGSADEVAQRLRARYRTQLAWYARALEAASGQPVTRQLIWHLPTGQAVCVG